MAKNIQKLIQKLTDNDPSLRREAAEELADSDERAVYPLVKALNDENAGVQDAAMRALIRIGGETTAYMVLPLLREGSLLRNTALIILRELGSATVPLLYPLLKDKDPDIRKFAIDLLGEIKDGADPSEIIPYLKDVNANVRAAAVKALSELEHREAIPELIHALNDDEWVCFSALEALGQLQAENAIEQIAGLLSGSSEKVRTAVSEAVRLAVIETLGKLGTEKAIDILRTYLPKTTGEERNAVIKSLLQIGITPEMADLSEHLVTMLREGDWEEKEIALKGLVTLNSKAAVPLIVDIAGALDPSLPENEERLMILKDAVRAIESEDALLELLESSDIKYRGKSFAIEVLGDARSRKSVPHLVNYLNDMRRDLRRASTNALGSIGASESVEPLLEASQRDVDAHVRRSAIEALGNIQAKDAFEPLMELLALERYYDVIEKIVEALLKINARAFLNDVSRYNDNIREIIAKMVRDADILLKLAEDPNKKIKIASIYSLGHIGTDKALSRLIRFLGDQDPDIRKAAVVGLGKARYCSPELFEALHDDDSWVRFYAVKAVALSCDKEEAVRRISSMLHDSFIPVVMSAIDALVEIGGGEAFEALSAHEQHHNPDVREKVREALSSL